MKAVLTYRMELKKFILEKKIEDSDVIDGKHWYRHFHAWIMLIWKMTIGIDTMEVGYT